MGVFIQDKKPDDKPKETYYTEADMTDATMVEFEKYISKQQVLFGEIEYFFYYVCICLIKQIAKLFP